MCKSHGQHNIQLFYWCGTFEQSSATVVAKRIEPAKQFPSKPKSFIP